MRTSTARKQLQEAIAAATDTATILKLTGRLTRVIEVEDRAKGRRAKARNKKDRTAAKAAKTPAPLTAAELAEEFEFDDTPKPINLTQPPLSQSAIAAQRAKEAEATTVTFNKLPPAPKVPPAPRPNGWTRTLDCMSFPVPSYDPATGRYAVDDVPYSSIGVPQVADDRAGFLPGADCVESNPYTQADGFSWKNSKGDWTCDRVEKENADRREREAEERRVWKPFLNRG